MSGLISIGSSRGFENWTCSSYHTPAMRQSHYGAESVASARVPAAEMTWGMNGMPKKMG